MTPKRHDRVAPPPASDEWTLRFDNTNAAHGWEQLCKQAGRNTRRAWEALSTTPRPNPSHERHHRLKAGLATAVHGGTVLEQWQYEVTGAGRIWYLVDDATRTVWLTFAATGHPKATD
ncbi:MAG: hypothetical protein WCA46_22345 [Actinocatenispora sp.]